MEKLKPCLPFKRFTRTYEGGEAWLPAREISLMGDGELTGPAIDRLALYESLLQMEPAEVALKLRRAAPENDYAALKAQYDEINRYNISCTKKIDELLAEKLDTDTHLKAINDSLAEQLRRAAPENKADPDGLHVKYDVRKLDGTPVFNCFVLRPNKDPSAVVALRAYAEATENKALAEDIYRWVGKPENKPLTCEGCKHESDIEFPCDFCCRNFKDRYAARKPEGSAP